METNLKLATPVSPSPDGISTCKLCDHHIYLDIEYNWRHSRTYDRECADLTL